MIIRTMQTADAVLAVVDGYIGESDVRYYLTPYENGREHGWTLSRQLSNVKVAFAEYRNTDQIVVYSGLSMHFESAGNVPSEQVYSERELFSPMQIFDAAQYIVQLLQKDGAA